MPKITLTINGKQHQVDASPELVLIDLLRKDLHLTGTKQSCDRKGQCGACVVIVDGKAVRSCLTKVTTLEGSEVISVEGLGTPENPHLIQEAYVLSGAIQCGFCTPGLIMATKALLDANPNPERCDQKSACAQPLRCTGYKKIVEAVQLAGKFNARRSPLRYTRNLARPHWQAARTPTACSKPPGLAQFNMIFLFQPTTLEMPGCAALTSPQHTFHATSTAGKDPVVGGIVGAADIKGTNRLRQVHPDQPVLCEDRVRVLGDPIVAIAAETREQARAAAAAVKVEYESLPVLKDTAEALAPGAVAIHAHAPDNICCSQPIIKGDADAALARSKWVYEGVFSTQTNHQAPLEPEVSSAYFEGEGEERELVVVGRSINIHFHLNQLKESLGHEKMRYREAFSGGQFGIKVWIITEAIAAAAALKFNRAVRYSPTMAESMLITTKRHAYPNMQVKFAADEQGHLTAFFCDFTMDKGAYTVNGPVILGRAIMMSQGSYNIPDMKCW